MTLDISNVVNVSITRQTQFPSGPGFGTLMILGPDSTGVIPLAERIRFYATIDEVAADFAASDEEYKAAATYFSQNPRPIRVAIGVRDALEPTTLGDELDAIVNISDDWYGFMLTSDARISANPNLSGEAAAWAEPRTKLFQTATNEAAAIAAGGGLPGVFATSGYDRSGVWYHQLAEDGANSEYPEASIFGSMLTVDFNGFSTTKTAKFKKMPGIPVTPMTQSELGFLLANAGNAYVDIAGNSMSLEGTMASGEFFDIMHGLDWLQSDIAFRVYGALAVNPKIPYTNQGMAILAAEVRGALQQGVRNGLLADQFDDDNILLPAFTVTYPSVLTASAANRGNRIAPPIAFTGQIAGAIHKASVDGVVTI